jgi:hypothetical protein
MPLRVLITAEIDKTSFAENTGIPESEVPENFASEFALQSDSLTWRVESSELLNKKGERPSDLVQVILKRPRDGAGGGIPLTRGEVAMLFLDGYAGDGPGLLDIRSQGYGDDNDWDGLTEDDVLQDEDTAFVWSKWEPFELWVEPGICKNRWNEY